jgi:DNA-binding transcriptional LysR family regulator
MSLKFRQVEAFRAVMREGSMMRAGDIMSISQPAVSYLVGSLERAVGFALFLRKGGKLVPTPEAHQLLAEVEQVYQGLEDIETAARQIANHQRAVIRILITPAMTGGGIIQAIGRFALGHPGIQLDIDVTHRTAIMHRIHSGQADVGILSLPETDAAPACVNLFTSHLRCVFPSGLVKARSKVRPEHLAGLPVIALRQTSLIRPHVDSWFAAAGIRPVHNLQVGDSGAAVELVRSGLGVTIVSSFSVPGGAAAGAQPVLQSLPLDPPVHIKIGAVVPDTPSPNRSVAALVDALREDLSK